MKVDVLTQKGNKSSKKIEIKDAVFSADMNKSLMDQYVYVHLINVRQGTRSTKGRGEVTGTGRKPWKNNKVAMARAGDRKSNIFRSGGVSHGPKPRVFEALMPKKMRRKALYSSLSLQMKDGKILFLDNMKFKKEKLTKQAVDFIKDFSLDGEKVLIITPSKDDDIKKAFSNIQKFKVLASPFINTYDILNSRKILILKDSLEGIPGYKEV